jgi:sugar phosphate isomerase/epimerase
MKNVSLFTLVIAALLSVFSCSQRSSRQQDNSSAGEMEDLKKEKIDHSTLDDMENLVAWCIVPFDIKKRTPEERINMLMELGLRSYAYDWREEHLATMAKEFRLARENGIGLKAVWLWIDANSDAPGQLSESNEAMLAIVKDAGLETQIWAGFNVNYFEGLTGEEAVRKGVEMVGYLAGRVEGMGCKLALYNHGDWFGEPANQVRIIEKLPGHSIGIIYNFHHAHEQIDRLPEIIEIMKPYLWVVNLNGMRQEGPMILPIGAGDLEAEMIDQILASGFKGPFGILGHVEDADVALVLKGNLEGLRSLYK